MREIALTQGQTAIVDDQDYDWLSQWRWYAVRSRETWYAGHTFGRRPNRCMQTMHQLIIDATLPETADHKDGNGLNNTRA
ncbi:hypothetical protein LCGC14_3157660, partial [marine sediment metagenome]